MFWQVRRELRRLRGGYKGELYYINSFADDVKYRIFRNCGITRNDCRKARSVETYALHGVLSVHGFCTISVPLQQAGVKLDDILVKVTNSVIYLVRNGGIGVEVRYDCSTKQWDTRVGSPTVQTA